MRAPSVYVSVNGGVQRWIPSEISVGTGPLIIPWERWMCWGDAIQGSRIIPYVAPYWRGIGATLVVRRELVRLFSHLGLPVLPFEMVDLVVPGGKWPRNLVPEGIWLPHFEHMELSQLWADDVFQFVLDRRVFQVGLCWHGSGGERSALGLDDWRCVPASMLLPLLSVPGVEFTALHFTDHAQALQRVPEGHGIQSLSDLGVWDFAGTAAVMKRLDLVITIDTSVAHLAGNLGVPTWLMLVSPCHSGWDENRWNCTPPLYPSVRQFRQETPGDWQRVVAEVEAELRNERAVRSPEVARRAPPRWTGSIR